MPARAPATTGSADIDALLALVDLEPHEDLAEPAARAEKHARHQVAPRAKEPAFAETASMPIERARRVRRVVLLVLALFLAVALIALGQRMLFGDHPM